MKKLFKTSLLILAAVSITLVGCKKEETKKEETPETFYASTTATTKVAVLEDFTGVRCGYCPDGHVRAKAMKDANPTKVIVIAVHGGSYAAPAAGWMDFTTPMAAAFIAQAKVSGYPAGTINRRPAAELGATAQIAGGMAMSRGSWATSGTVVQAEAAPVNLGGTATWNEASRELTIKVDMYFTSDETVATNLNVALLQDGIPSKQSGAATNPYMQDNVLRGMPTGTWGEVVATAATKGTKVSKTYVMAIPTEYGSGPDGGGLADITKMRVAVFAARGQANILNGVEIAIK